MSEIEKVNNNLEQQQRELRRTSSLRDMLTRKNAKRVCLALDVSGSMGTICANGNRAIDNLHEAVKDLPPVVSFAFGCFHHSGQDVQRFDNQTQVPHQAGGGTPLAQALEMAKIEGFTRVVVVTDGQPDSKEAAFRAAQGLQIDAIYIGDPPVPAFLQQLCNQTGGSFAGNVSINSVDFVDELESGIRGLLEGGK
jgi:hypothetical protein